MPAEHYRITPEGTVGLYQGYFCMYCGAGGVNMVGTGHGVGKCESNTNLVNELLELNKRS